MFDVLDDWVVIAVKQENQLCQNAVKQVRQAVQENKLQLDSVRLQSTNLQSNIETIEFYDGPPSYFSQAKPNYALHLSRVSLDSVQLIYRQLRAQQQDTILIDSQTFLCQTMLNIQQDVLPNVWRYIPYSNIKDLADSLTA